MIMLIRLVILIENMLVFGGSCMIVRAYIL